MITLSRQQLKSLFNKKSASESGLNEILTITLNAIINSGRTAYLQANEIAKDKANGYRSIKSVAMQTTCPSYPNRQIEYV